MDIFNAIGIMNTTYEQELNWNRIKTDRKPYQTLETLLIILMLWKGLFIYIYICVYVYIYIYIHIYIHLLTIMYRVGSHPSVTEYN